MFYLFINIFLAGVYDDAYVSKNNLFILSETNEQRNKLSEIERQISINASDQQYVSTLSKKKDEIQKSIEETSNILILMAIQFIIKVVLDERKQQLIVFNMKICSLGGTNINDLLIKILDESDNDKKKKMVLSIKFNEINAQLDCFKIFNYDLVYNSVISKDPSMQSYTSFFETKGKELNSIVEKMNEAKENDEKERLAMNANELQNQLSEGQKKMSESCNRKIIEIIEMSYPNDNYSFFIGKSSKINLIVGEGLIDITVLIIDNISKKSNKKKSLSKNTTINFNMVYYDVSLIFDISRFGGILQSKAEAFDNNFYQKMSGYHNELKGLSIKEKKIKEVTIMNEQKLNIQKSEAMKFGFVQSFINKVSLIVGEIVKKNTKDIPLCICNNHFEIKTQIGNMMQMNLNSISIFVYSNKNNLNNIIIEELNKTNE